MSKVVIQQITCPKCGSISEQKIYQSVNINLDPNMREEVLNGNVFKFHCPSCKASLSIYYPLLYHDMNNKFMIQFDPKNEYDEEEFKTLENMNPMKGYLYRIVHIPYQLIDKILIFEQKLDDKVIEVLKEFLKASNNNSEIRELDFAKMKDDTFSFICVNNKGEAIGMIPYSNDLYDMIYEKFYDKLKDIKKYKIDSDFAQEFLNNVEI